MYDPSRLLLLTKTGGRSKLDNILCMILRKFSLGQIAMIVFVLCGVYSQVNPITIFGENSISRKGKIGKE